jgi:hypothetical protein
MHAWQQLVAALKGRKSSRLSARGEAAAMPRRSQSVSRQEPGASAILALTVPAPSYGASDNRVSRKRPVGPGRPIRRASFAGGRHSPDSTLRSTGRRVIQVTNCG